MLGVEGLMRLAMVGALMRAGIESTKAGVIIQALDDNDPEIGVKTGRVALDGLFRRLQPRIDLSGVTWADTVAYVHGALFRHSDYPHGRPQNFDTVLRILNGERAYMTHLTQTGGRLAVSPHEFLLFFIEDLDKNAKQVKFKNSADIQREHLEKPETETEIIVNLSLAARNALDKAADNRGIVADD